MSQLATPKQCAYSIMESGYANSVVLNSLVHHMPDAEFLRSVGVTADRVMAYHVLLLEEWSRPSLHFPGIEEYLDAVYEELSALELVVAA